MENIIKKLVRNNSYNEALDICNKLLIENEIEYEEILRLRAYVYSHKGDYSDALADRKKIIESGKGILKDYYLAGDNAMELGDFKGASFFLNNLLLIADEQKEFWFNSAALFNLAYVQMELGSYEESSIHLDNAVQIEPNCSMPLPGKGVWGHEKLREEIQRRKSQEK